MKGGDYRLEEGEDDRVCKRVEGCVRLPDEVDAVEGEAGGSAKRGQQPHAHIVGL